MHFFRRFLTWRGVRGITRHTPNVLRMKVLLTFAIGCCVALLPTQAEETHYPGNPDHPAYAAHKRLNALRTGAPSSTPGHPRYVEQGKPLHVEYQSELIGLIRKLDGSENARRAVLARMESHPEEINDWWSHDGWSGTPLTEAMQKKDKDLVVQLLAKGAIPFPPPGASFWKNRAEGNPAYAEILDIIAQAQRTYPIYTSILYSDTYRMRHAK